MIPRQATKGKSLKTNSTRPFMVIAILILTSLACGLPAMIAKPTATPIPTEPAAMTTEQAQQFEDNMQATLNSPNAEGQVTVTITEAQLNAYLANKMTELQQDPSSPQGVVRDPKITLLPGKVEVTGKVTLSGFDLEAQASVLPSVDDTGKPVLKVQSIKVGPVPVPDALIGQVNDQIGSVLDDYLTSNDVNFKVQSITVSQGLITVVGTRSK